MASACDCCAHHVRCCSCFYTKQQQKKWSKSLRNFPQFSSITCSLWLERGGKKNAGEKSYKFFREGYVYNIYTCEESGDFYVKSRCYRSLFFLHGERWQSRSFESTLFVQRGKWWTLQIITILSCSAIYCW